MTDLSVRMFFKRALGRCRGNAPIDVALRRRLDPHARERSCIHAKATRVPTRAQPTSRDETQRELRSARLNSAYECILP
jgi:hypothetical protein